MESSQPLDTGFERELTITGEIRSFLTETAKWAKFLAIAGFVFMALMVAFGLFAGTMLSQFGGGVLPGSFFSIIYIAIAAIYIFPILYLYRFATNMQSALRNDDQQFLSTAFMNLKSHYKFVGILMIVILVFYALAFVLGGIGMLTAGF